MALLLILVSVASFGLGRQSITFVSQHSQPAGIVFSEDVVSAQVTIPISQDTSKNKAALEERVVASKSGTKYHLLSCPGASQIKESNKVYFDSFVDAKAAGYTPAANCLGLK